MSELDQLPGLAVVTAEQLRALVRAALAAELDERDQQTPTTQPELVDSRALMQLLGGISRTTLQRWRELGLPFLRIGDTFRYRPRDVLAWLESGSAAQATENTRSARAGTIRRGAKRSDAGRKKSRFPAEPGLGARAEAAAGRQPTEAS